MAVVWGRGLVAAVVAAGLAASAVAQTGGFGQPTLSVGRQAMQPAGPNTTTTTTGSIGPTTTTGPGTGATGQLSGPWEEILTLADQIATAYDLRFNAPWEEALFVLMVARMWVEMQMMGDFQGGQTGPPHGQTTQQPGTTVGGPLTAGSGGFGGGSLAIGQTARR